MKNSLLFIFFCLFAVSSTKAQITITNSAFASIGDVLKTRTAASPGQATNTVPAGTNLTWDFTSIIGNDLNTNTVVAASTGIHASLFSSATFILPDLVFPGENYIKKSTDEAELLGFSGDPLGIGLTLPVVFNDSKLILKTPLNYQDTYTDYSDFQLALKVSDYPTLQHLIDSLVPPSSGVIIDSLRITYTDTTTNEVDAWGTMTLPTSNLPTSTYDVLRLKQSTNSNLIVEFTGIFFTVAFGWTDPSLPPTSLSLPFAGPSSVVTYQFLNDEVTIITNILKKQATVSASLQQEVQWEPATVDLSEHHHSIRHYIRVIAANDRVLIETPGLSRAVNVQAFPLPSYNFSNKIVKERHGKSFMLVSVFAQISKTQSPFIIQVALDVSHQQAIIQNYHNRMIWVLLLGVVLSALLGVLVARQGMRSLGLMTEKLKHVDVDKLHERLLVENFPRELVGTVLALNNMLARLEDAFQRLSDFSSNLAHELRTPINSLMVQAEVVLAQKRSSEEYKEALISILEENQRLAYLIDRLLFLARAENPKMHVGQDDIALHELVHACREFYEAVAEERDIKVVCYGEARLKADSLLLQRATNNLLSNALYYTEPGGVIILTIEALKDRVTLVVSDTGVGIAQEHINKLFDRFYRVDDTRACYSGGTGLGLAIVKTIMDLHHGSIAVQSTPGDGTSITLTFPLEK